VSGTWYELTCMSRLDNNDRVRDIQYVMASVLKYVSVQNRTLPVHKELNILISRTPYTGVTNIQMWSNFFGPSVHSSSSLYALLA